MLYYGNTLQKKGLTLNFVFFFITKNKSKQKKMFQFVKLEKHRCFDTKYIVFKQVTF